MRLLPLLTQHRPAIIAGYYPIHNEISALPTLLDMATLYNTRLALPVVSGEGQPLLFRQWHEHDRLEKGAFNILQPGKSAAELIPDLVIVPLLAFDSRGFRLGYGGGFYDRTLSALRAENPGLLAVGIGYGVQHSPEALPTDKFDQALDYMVTDTGLWNFSL